jgi:tetratricopeptide (TPR) repeat protein
MFLRVSKYPLILALFICAMAEPTRVFAQRATPNPGAAGGGAGGQLPGDAVVPSVEIDVYVKGPNGAPLDVMAMVTVTARTGLIYGQGTTQSGNIKFSGLAPSEYTIQVVAIGYEKATQEVEGNNTGDTMVIVEMRPDRNGENSAQAPAQIVLAPKAQKELDKAREALRINKPSEARSHLEAAARLSPNHPEVNYLLGFYYLQTNEREKAKSYWMKVLEFDPKHVRAMLSLSETLMLEKKLADAETYVKRAVETDPSSWRAHATFANVAFLEKMPEQAAKEAERALELGHGQAAMVQPLLARALAESGNKERAIRVLQDFVQEHPADSAAKKQLENLQSALRLVQLSPSTESAGAEADVAETKEAAKSLALPSSWLPPDVDERVPAVEPGAVCALDEVLQKAGKRIEEFVKNVDRFTATESLQHESIDKWGIAGSAETRKFDYVVSIQESRAGFLNVEEYRGRSNSAAEFPGGVATNGLPAMALIFHPLYAKNYDMSCEGLGRWGGRLAWQVHFRQRADKPNIMRAYRLGEYGPAYQVALRGRAWFAADSYQIVRVETDLVAPIPEIRLVADHTAIEYGPVRFRNRNVEMWLPESAEVYSDWKGRRMHRRHSFSNYLLFSVDEKQRISEPKTETENRPGN